MNVLILTPQRPYPLHQGTSIRNFNIIEQLAQRHQITLLSFLEPDQTPNHGPLVNLCQEIITLPVPQRSTTTRLKQMLTTTRPDMSWRLWSDDFDATLADLLQRGRFDVVQIEGIEMAPYIPTVQPFMPPARLVYDDHNAEWLLQQRNFQADVKNPARWIAAAYSYVQTHRLKRYERQVCEIADGVVAVSEADREALHQLNPNLAIDLVPNGVDLETYAHPPTESIPADLVFTGKMDYRPNIDAILWFAQRVLPLVRKARPQTTLAVVGRRPHPRLDPLKEDPTIFVTGFVEDIAPYIAGGSVYIAPFRVGGGTRLKLLQAMAMRKAIVATAVGAEGFPITSGQEMILEDDPALMAEHILRLLQHPAERLALGNRAYDFVSAHYAWARLVPTFETLYEPTS